MASKASERSIARVAHISGQPNRIPINTTAHIAPQARTNIQARPVNIAIKSKRMSSPANKRGIERAAAPNNAIKGAPAVPEKTVVADFSADTNPKVSPRVNCIAEIRAMAPPKMDQMAMAQQAELISMKAVRQVIVGSFISVSGWLYKFQARNKGLFRYSV